jgi:hypothetical protein
MGSIISSRVQSDGKVIYEIGLDKEEALQLKGHMDNIHVFSEDSAVIKSRISLRGKNEATKYFLIPRELRDDIRKSKEVTCQKIETKSKTVYIYVVDKFKL